jgi:hypothetical protein
VGQRSPAYYGYFGPDFADWIKTNTALAHRMLIGRRTYEAMAGLPAEVRDEGWQRTTTTPGWLFSRSLEATDWPGLKIVRDDLVGFVRKLKRTDGPELRTLESMSLVRQLLASAPWLCRKRALNRPLKDYQTPASTYSRPGFLMGASCFSSIGQQEHRHIPLKGNCGSSSRLVLLTTSSMDKMTPLLT